jgi:LAO/AO transport system kinase
MKAGIMEMADIFVVNKADLPGAQKAATDIKRIAALSRRGEGAWRAPVVLTSSLHPESLAALSEEIDRHQKWLAGTEVAREMLRGRVRYRLKRVLERRVAQVVAQIEAHHLDEPMDQLVRRAMQALAKGR